MRLFLVEWKKMIHQKLFYIIGVFLIGCGMIHFMQVNKSYKMIGEEPIKTWEDMKKKEDQKVFAEQMIMNWQNGDWIMVVKEKLKLEKERFDEMSSFEEEETLRSIQFQIAQYEYLLDYNIPIWDNIMEVNGWNIMNLIMRTMIPWTALGVGILGAVIMSREKNTLTSLFMVPYGKGMIILSKVAVLIVAGIGFLICSVGLPTLIAAGINGMGSYNYPLPVSQKLFQISAEKELAPLIICLVVIFYNGVLFLSVVAAFSTFCSVWLMESVYSVGVVLLIFGVGRLLLTFLPEVVIPVLEYGNSDLLLDGLWDFFSGIFIMILFGFFFIAVSIQIVKSREIGSKGGDYHHSIKSRTSGKILWR